MKFKLIKLEKKKRAKNQKLPTNEFEIQFNKQTITIYQQKLIDSLLLNKINPDLNKQLKQVFEYLASDEDNEEEGMLLFDELARLRGIAVEYDDKLSKKAQEKYMRKIRFAAFELKKQLMEYNMVRKKSPKKVR